MEPGHGLEAVAVLLGSGRTVPFLWQKMVLQNGVRVLRAGEKAKGLQRHLSTGQQHGYVR